MPIPRCRIRTLMIAVAVMAVAAGTAVAAWREPVVAVAGLAVFVAAVFLGLVISPFVIFSIRLARRCLSAFRHHD